MEAEKKEKIYISPIEGDDRGTDIYRSMEQDSTHVSNLKIDSWNWGQIGPWLTQQMEDKKKEEEEEEKKR